jgi:LmbE family N-acetylglucosaminyl deacetylase
MKLPKRALEKSVLVVAHPDDEVLWFSSILDDVTSIVIVFMDTEQRPDRDAARKASLAEHEYRDKIVLLDLAQVKSHNASTWPQPVETAYGLHLGRLPALDDAYAEQAARVTAALAPHIDGALNVFTHNPWGEYGHEDHVQLCKVATALAAERGADVWYSNYVSGKSSRLMRQYLGGFDNPYYTMAVDGPRARQIADTYVRNGAWTFDDDFVWFPTECFVKGPLDSHAATTEGTLFPVNYMRVPFDPITANAPPPGLLQRFLRRLRSVHGNAAAA